MLRLNKHEEGIIRYLRQIRLTNYDDLFPVINNGLTETMEIIEKNKNTLDSVNEIDIKRLDDRIEKFNGIYQKTYLSYGATPEDIKDLEDEQLGVNVIIELKELLVDSVTVIQDETKAQEFYEERCKKNDVDPEEGYRDGYQIHIFGANVE